MNIIQRAISAIVDKRPTYRDGKIDGFREAKNLVLGRLIRQCDCRTQINYHPNSCALYFYETVSAAFERAEERL